MACLTQKYFRNNFRLKIKSLKNIEAEKIQHSFIKGRIKRNQSPISLNTQYIVRNLLNKFIASGTLENSWEGEKEKHSTKYFWRLCN